MIDRSAELRRRLSAGEPIVPLAGGAADSADNAETLTIQAEWIQALVAQPQRQVSVPIVLEGVIIRGALDLKYATFPFDFSITASSFDSDVDLSFANFQKVASLEGSRFEKRLAINAAHVAGELNIQRASVAGDFEAQQLAVSNSLLASGATFHVASCEYISVDGNAEFGTANGDPATFLGPASFLGSHIGGQAIFSSAQFHGPAHFDLCQFDGGAFFDIDSDDPPVSMPAHFRSEAEFVGASVKMQLKADRAWFEGPADFDGLSVSGDAHFEGARFGSDDPVSPPVQARFPGIQVTGQLIFEDASLEADFLLHQSTISAEALFARARFARKTRFDGTHFLGPVFFRDRDGSGPANFVGEASFAGVTADHDVHFEGCVFVDNLILRDASFNVVYFRGAASNKIPPNQPPQFAPGKNVDLRGFSYTRIYVAPRELLPRIEPFDKQPYLLLAKTFKTMGKDKYADEVYIEQRKRSMLYNFSRPGLRLKAIREWLYYVSCGFGTKPLRLFVASIVLMLAFAFVFSEPGAVSPKQKETAARTLTWMEGLGVSFNSFLPISVPVGDAWQPTENPCFGLLGQPFTFSFLATILKILGWLFVPLGTAALTGLIGGGDNSSN